MTWKQIKQPEDPDWVEWIDEIIHDKVCIGEICVWQNMDGYFNASVTWFYNGWRVVKSLEATTIESAKTEAEQWARGE